MPLSFLQPSKERHMLSPPAMSRRPCANSILPPKKQASLYSMRLVSIPVLTTYMLLRLLTKFTPRAEGSLFSLFARLHLILVLQVKQFLSYCGGLPAPECSNNPLGYKFSWSSRGVLLALLNSASFIASGQTVSVPGSELMSHAKPYYITPAFAFVAYPNRDSTPFSKWYNIPEAETVVRGTLRYQGFPEFIGALVKLGWLDQTQKSWLLDSLTWAEVTQKAIGATGSAERYIVLFLLCRNKALNITLSQHTRRTHQAALLFPG